MPVERTVFGHRRLGRAGRRRRRNGTNTPALDPIVSPKIFVALFDDDVTLSFVANPRVMGHDDPDGVRGNYSNIGMQSA